MSRETANAARYAKGLTVLTELEGDLLEALEFQCPAYTCMRGHCDQGRMCAHIAKAHGE